MIVDTNKNGTQRHPIMSHVLVLLADEFIIVAFNLKLRLDFCGSQKESWDEFKLRLEVEENSPN